MSPRRLVAALAATLAAPAAVPAGAAAGPVDVAANVNVVLGQTLRPRADLLLGRAREMGMSHARSDAFWYWNEPREPRTETTIGLPPLFQPKTTRRHTYLWAASDAVSERLAAHGMRWQPVLTYSPPWAQTQPGNTHSRPKRADDFAAWAGAFAARYGSRGNHAGPYPVHRYEIWNEPNFDFFFRGADPAFYGRMLLAAARAIRDQDPDAVIVSGGLSLSRPAEFLDRAIKANPDLKRGAISEVGLHPYGKGAPQVVASVREMRRSMDQIGLAGRPLALTEMGWRVLADRQDRGALPDRTRAGSLALSLDALTHSDCNVSTIEVYTWATLERTLAYGNDWWGLVTPGGALRPPARALRAARDRAFAPRVPLQVCTGRPGGRPLALRLRLASRSARCHRYRVTYTGWPVNAVRVAGRGRGGRRAAGTTDRNGRVSLCGRKLGRVLRVRAAVARWASSPWVRG